MAGRGALNFGLDTYEKALRALAGVAYSNDSQVNSNESWPGLRALRESKSMSQEALGEEVGFSVTYISVGSNEETCQLHSTSWNDFRKYWASKRKS